MTNQIIEQLKIGDRRTTGEAEAVVKLVLKNPSLVEDLLVGLEASDAGVRMRTADALEKISVENLKLLQPHLTYLLTVAASATQQEVQWHLAQILPRLHLNEVQTKKVVTILENNFQTSPSNIVRVFSLQGLADIAQTHSKYEKSFLRLLKLAAESEAPSLRARARILATKKLS